MTINLVSSWRYSWRDTVSAIPMIQLGVSNPGLPEILYQDRQGRIWLSFENSPGLWEFNEAAGYFTQFSLEDVPNFIRIFGRMLLAM